MASTEPVDVQFISFGNRINSKHYEEGGAAELARGTLYHGYELNLEQQIRVCDWAEALDLLQTSEQSEPVQDLVRLFDALLPVKDASVTLWASDHPHAVYAAELWASARELEVDRYDLDGAHGFYVYRKDGVCVVTVYTMKAGGQ